MAALGSRRRGPRRISILFAAGLIAAPAWARAAPTDWHLVVTNRDHARLKTWRDDFVRALAQARAAGFGARIDAEGALLQPDAATDMPQPPDGRYRCRLIRIGVKAAPAPGATLTELPVATGGAAFTEQPAAACEVKDGMFAVLDGAQRPGGRLYPYDDARRLLLGGLALSDELGMVRYGRDPDRNLVGLMERIGEAKWRLILPAPQWQALLDVVEIVPDRP